MSGGIGLDTDGQPGTAQEQVVFLDRALWTALGAARPDAAFASAWLTLQCRQLKDVQRGLLVLLEQGALVPAARWPDGDGGSTELSRTVSLCVEHKRGIANVSRAVSGPDAKTSCLAYPILVEGELQGVVGIVSTATGDAAVRALMNGLHWGTSWLELALWRAKTGDLTSRVTRTSAALEILSVVLAADRFDDQARNAATEIANRTGAARVSLGWVRRRRIKVMALSHGVTFSRRAETIALLSAAMDEAVDQAQTISIPPPEGGRTLVTRAHQAISEKGGGGAVLSVPMVCETEIVGVVLLEYERASALDQSQVDLVEAVATLLAPVLERSRIAERSVVIHAASSVRSMTAHVFGAGHLALKLGLLAAAVLITFFSLFHVEYKVAGRSTVEGQIRRTIAAAIDGYVASEHARAGQTIRKDAVLATLDATEFTLQRLRWIAVREQHDLELSKDLAAGQRADVNIIRSQIDEADAQIALLDDQIKRTVVVAPFDGIVLSGDLSQSVGAPVQRAQVLFEIAPLDAYRVVVRIPDSEIGHIEPGSTGTVVLSALPDERFPFTVMAITPVTEVSEGENAFKVEGRLDRVSDRLRPNMEGVAKIDVGRHLLIWVWTHRLITAVRLALWSWWP